MSPSRFFLFGWSLSAEGRPIVPCLVNRSLASGIWELSRGDGIASSLVHMKSHI